MSGDARKDALREDVTERATEFVSPAPALPPRVRKRNYAEAYDDVQEEVETPGGGMKSVWSKVEVDTPTFLSRLESRPNLKLQSMVSASMVSYVSMMKKVDDEGFKVKTGGGTDLPKGRKPATTIGINTHKAMLEAKDNTIKNLRAQISRAKQSAAIPLDKVPYQALHDELQCAKIATGSLLTKNEILRKEKDEIYAKLELAHANQVAAVAQAKFETMQHMYNSQLGGPQSASKGASDQRGSVP